MDLPSGAIIVSSLLVVEYMDADGEIYIESEATGSDAEELEFSKLLELLEHAKINAVAPYLAQAVASYCMEDDDEEG